MRAPEIDSVYCRQSDDDNPALWGKWYISITHDAFCGHASCGLDYTVIEFATASEAMTFIANLPTSWEKYNA